MESHAFCTHCSVRQEYRTAPDGHSSCLECGHTVHPVICRAARAHQRDAKRHFEAGGSVLVSEYGNEADMPVTRGMTTHSLATTTWDQLVSQVREWRNRYPNQRFYVVPQ